MGSQWKTLEKGIYEADDGRNRTRPFMWKQTLDGVKYREFFETLRDAKAAKASKLAEVRKYGRITHEFSPADWREFSQARELLRGMGATVLDAVREYVQRRGSQEGKTIEAHVADYLAVLELNKVSASYMASTKLRLNHLSREFGTLYPADVSQADIEIAISAMAKAGRSRRTLLNYRNDWHSFFAYLADRGCLAEPPTKRIKANYLPQGKRPVGKRPLPVCEVEAIMAWMEAHRPKWAFWMAMQFFMGVRAAESYRMRFEWFDRVRRIVTLPGWVFDEQADEMTRVTKTGDAWMIDKAPANLWAWLEAYGNESGPVPAPDWDSFRRMLAKHGVISSWPHNCRRDSFCTYHMSAFRDPAATALILKHRGTDTLWRSYMGVLRTEEEGISFFKITPKLA